MSADTNKKIVYSPVSGPPMKTPREAVPATCLQRMTRSIVYEGLSAACIIINSIYIAVETQLRSSAVLYRRHDIARLDWYLNLTATLFCIAFSLDLVLRLMAERWQYLRSKDRGWNGWNLFELIVVGMSVIEVSINWWMYIFSANKSGLEYLGQLSLLRIVRLIRVIRVTRAIRIIRFIKELRHMVNSISGAMRSLFWAIVLMLIILLVFGVFFTEGVVSYCLENDAIQDESSEELRNNFGDLVSSFVLLYSAMLGGQEWLPIMTLLMPMPLEYKFAFLVFITFSVLALLNVITAVFVESAMGNSRLDKEIQAQQYIEEKRTFDKLLRKLFLELDCNASGSLSLAEMEASMNDERVVAYMRSLELDIGQVRTLFTLLDVSNSGEVDVEEFVEGCLRLRGGARSLDIGVLKVQVEWILYNIETLHQLLVARRTSPSPK